VQAAIAELAANGPGGSRRRAIGLTHSHVVSGVEHRNLEIILEHVLSGAELMAHHLGFELHTLQNSYLLREPGGYGFLNNVEGVITAGGLVAPPLIEVIQRRKLPVVVIGGHVPELGVPSVAADNLAGMRLVVTHLLDHGHRRIGLVNGPTDTYTSVEKKAGYLTALVDAGISPDPCLIRWRDGMSGFDMAEGQVLAAELLQRVDPPTALVFANDAMAHGGIAACREAGLSVPGDVSIVGFHDDPDARLAQPQLTSVRVDRSEWGAAAVRRLASAIDGEWPVVDRLLLPVELIVRASSGPVRST
jgi:LacI family transcriptional regulator